MNESNFSENIAVEQSSSPEMQYSVKMYHPDEGMLCENKGKSVRFKVLATSKADLRTKTESSQHEFFNGDCCNKCGALAKVSFSVDQK